MTTVNLPLQRNDFFKDLDGLLTTSKGVAEVRPYTINWADGLDTSETIAASTWESSGPTLSGDSKTTTTTTVTVTGVGLATNTITTSAGRTLVQRLRFVDPDVRSVRDYRC